MDATKMGEAAGLGAMILGGFGTLLHCGGGSSGATALGGDGGQNVSTSVRDAAALQPEGDASSGAPDVAPPPPQPCQSVASCTGPSTMACCGGFCVDTAKDPANCGKCGVACTASQFCTGTACDEAILANVCDNAKGTVAFDPYSEDNQAGSAMGAALSAGCMPPVSILQVSQSAQGVLEPGSGRPITGPGNTLITGGGAYGQKGEAYLETSISPVFLWTDGTTAKVWTRTGTALFTTAVSGLTVHHDFFYVQVSVEPRSGTLCLDGAGILGPGTSAAGYYAAAELIPNRAKYTASWYVYEWTDTNNDSIPNSGDMFTQVMAGE
jgi:Stigma-specific protein, Stig1